jgi:hypothetical protein
MDNYLLYRKYDEFGWQIVGWQAAKEEGKLYFGTASGGCRSGHAAPYLVHGRVCAKCYIIAMRNKLAMKSKKRKLTKAQLAKFWRKQLNLKDPAPDTKKHQYIYIVENFPYTNMKEAANISGKSANVIRYRCESEDFLDYFALPIKH